MDFLKQEAPLPFSQIMWPEINNVQLVQQQENVIKSLIKPTVDDSWKQDPRIQALIVDRMNQKEQKTVST